MSLDTVTRSYLRQSHRWRGDPRRYRQENLGKEAVASLRGQRKDPRRVRRRAVHKDASPRPGEGPTQDQAGAASLALFLFCFLFFSPLAVPHSMWDLSSLTRDRTCTPLKWKHRVLTTGPPGEPHLGASCTPETLGKSYALFKSRFLHLQRRGPSQHKDLWILGVDVKE